MLLSPVPHLAVVHPQPYYSSQGMASGEHALLLCHNDQVFEQGGGGAFPCNFHGGSRRQDLAFGGFALQLGCHVYCAVIIISPLISSTFDPLPSSLFFLII